MAGEVSHNAPEARQCAAGLVSAFLDEKRTFSGAETFCSLATPLCVTHLSFTPCLLSHLVTAYLAVTILYFLCVKDYLERKKIDFWLKTFSFNKDRFKDHLSLSSDYPNSYLLSGFFKLFFLIMFCNCL